MPVYTLYAPAGSFRAFSTLIAAEYNGVAITVTSDFDAGTVAAMSPSGKAPLLVLPNGQALFSSHAMARYVAGIRRDTGLVGDGSLAEAAIIDGWMDFAAQELELPSCVWFYPVAGYMPFNKEAYTKAKDDLAKGLAKLNDYLLTKTFLVGHTITLADIAVVSTLLYPFKLVADKNYLKPFPNVVRWFTTCVNQPAFSAVLGQVTFAKSEMTAPGQAAAPAAPAPVKAEKKKKEKKKKEEEEDDFDDVIAEPVKKEEHPYKIMDRDAPSKFSMDAWKKTYSNAATYEEAMAAFWETFDKDGWSLWHQNYNYNEDNKRIFMAGNAVGGFQQRSDEIRKWAFGVM